MAVYDVNGTGISAVFETDGDTCQTAYDIDGTVVFTGEPVNLTVMSYNVGNFYSEYYDCPTEAGQDFYNRADTIFGKYHPDVAGLQEYNSSIGGISSSVLMDDYFEDYYGVSKSSASAGRAIASTYQISNYAQVTYSVQSGETRYYLKGYINVGGRRVLIVSTHMSQTNSIQEGQMQELLALVANEQYFILMGDFNIFTTAVGDARYNAMIKPFLNAGYNSADNADGLYMTWYSGKTVAGSSQTYALDQIITSPNITINSVTVDDTKLTDGLCTQYDVIIDHLPIVASVTVR